MIPHEMTRYTSFSNYLRCNCAFAK